MMKRGRNIITSYMTLEYEFSGVRIQDGFLNPVDWVLSINLVAADKKNKTKEEIEERASFAYQRLYFWLDTNLPGIVVVDVDNSDDLYIANLSSNIMMYCPGIPGDDVIIQLLHSKLSKLANNDLIVGEIKLNSSDSSLQYTFDCVDGDYALPETTAEYYTDGSARDSIPWWFRNDGFCFEFIRPTDVQMNDEELFKDIVDPMDEFERIMNDTETIGIVREPARIVQVEKWKPRKV